MSKNTKSSMNSKTKINIPSGQANDEVQPFVKTGAKSPPTFIHRLMCMAEETRNMKRVVREWTPRVEFVVRLMLVATYLDDSFRVMTNFPAHVNQIGKQGCLTFLATAAPGLVSAIAVVALLIGLLAQSVGSACLLIQVNPDIATKALIGWTFIQPVLYVEFSNIEFIFESISLIGGLLLIRSHLVPSANALTQLLGRLLIPTVYVYHAWGFLSEAFTLDETSSFGMFIGEMSMFVVNTLVLVGLVMSTGLVAAGLKSRIIALVLALVNIIYVFYQHPFFRYIKLESFNLKIDENAMYWNLSLPHGVEPDDLTPAMIYDLHRYYFFLGLSTSGALLLLAMFGPGNIALEKDEELLPVSARCED